MMQFDIIIDCVFMSWVTFVILEMCFSYILKKL